MFHTLFDYQDQNVPNNNQLPKNKYKKYEKKFKDSKKTYYNYYGKGNEAYEYYNKKNESDEGSNNSEEEGNVAEKFENTKNKVNLVPIIFDYNYLILNLFLLIPYIIITIFDFILFFYSSIDLP
jgi:hypothetical protein